MPPRDDTVTAFCALDRLTLAQRSTDAGALARALRGIDPWTREGDGERSAFARRVLYTRWSIRNGLLSECDGDGRGY